MKISLRSVLKGIVAAGTAVGAGVLALQAKRSVDEDRFEPTLEPIGGTEPEKAEEKPEMEAIPAVDAEVVKEEETDNKEE